MVTTFGLLPSAGAAELRHAGDVAGESPLRVGRRDAQLRVQDRNPEPAADREHLVLRGLDQEQLLHLRELLRHLRGQVVGLRPVVLEVVEFPDVLVGRPVPDAGRQARDPRGARAEGRGHPAVMVDGAAAHDLEVLRAQPALGLRVVEGVGEADAVDRILRDAVDHARRRDADDLVDRRHDVVAVVELRARRRRRA